MDVGNVLMQLKDRKDRATDLTQSGLDQQAQQSAEAQINIAETDVSINDRTSDYYNKEYQSRFTFDPSKYGTSQAAKLAKINFDSRRDAYVSSKGIKNAQLAVKDAVQLTELNALNSNPINRELDRAKYEEALSLQDTPDGVAVKLAKNDAQYAEIQKKTSIEAIKPLLIDGWEAGKKEGLTSEESKQQSLTELRSNIEGLVKDGVLSKADAAEADKTLGDWMDNYVAGRNQKSKAAVKQTTKESYDGLMPILFDPALAQDRFQALDESPMPTKKKEQFSKYIKKSYEDSPTKTTAEGQKLANDAVFSAMTLKVSPTEAYDRLLEQRFIERSITDADFQSALQKIGKPYKKDTLESLKSTIIGNTAEVRSGFNTDAEEERLVDSNAAIVQWVDDELEAGNKPTRKEMNAMASQFRVKEGTLVNIGQSIKRGGQMWEVTGFDTDGEPLVEHTGPVESVSSVPRGLNPSVNKGGVVVGAGKKKVDMTPRERKAKAKERIKELKEIRESKEKSDGVDK